MKNIKTYNDYINENIKDLMKPKSKENLINTFKDLSKDKMEEVIYDDCVEYFDGDMDKFFDFIKNKIGINYVNRTKNIPIDDINASDVLEVMTEDELLKMFNIMISEKY